MMTNKKNAIRIIVVLALILFGLDIKYGDQAEAFFTPHRYVAFRDTPIKFHMQYIAGDSENKIPETTLKIVDSWYDPFHEFHEYTNKNEDEVLWKDLNGKWHKDNPITGITVRWIMIIISGILLTIIYRLILNWNIKPKNPHGV